MWVLNQRPNSDADAPNAQTKVRSYCSHHHHQHHHNWIWSIYARLMVHMVLTSFHLSTDSPSGHEVGPPFKDGILVTTTKPCINIAIQRILYMRDILSEILCKSISFTFTFAHTPKRLASQTECHSKHHQNSYTNIPTRRAVRGDWRGLEIWERSVCVRAVNLPKEFVMELQRSVNTNIALICVWSIYVYACMGYICCVWEIAKRTTKEDAYFVFGIKRSDGVCVWLWLVDRASFAIHHDYPIAFNGYI